MICWTCQHIAQWHRDRTGNCDYRTNGISCLCSKFSDSLDIYEITHEMCRLYFRRDGTPYRDIMEFAKDFEKGAEFRRVDDTILWWGGRVSTVWLGLNYDYTLEGPPIIFETMVFRPGTFSELDMDRYATEAQAKAGHKAMCKRWRFAFAKIVGIWMGILFVSVKHRFKK